jgi:hypothetical protein
MVDVWVVEIVSGKAWKSRQSVSRKEAAGLVAQWKDKQSSLVLVPAGTAPPLLGDVRIES